MAKAKQLPTIKRTELLICLGIVSIAIVVRLWYLSESSANPTFEIPIVDSLTYHSLAIELVEGKGLTEKVFWQPFFYPLFLSLAYFVSNSSIVFAKLLQILVGSFTCVLSYRLGRRVFGRWTGIAGALITAFYGPLIFFETELLATGWAAFWSVALILLFLKTREKNSCWLFFILGFCGALSVITRPTFLLFFLSGCCWLSIILYRSKIYLRLLMLRLATVLLGFSVVVLPVSIMNLYITDHFGFLPASGGVNCYIGNNPNRAGTLTIRPGEQWDNLTELSARYGVRGMWAEQKFFYRRVVEYARNRPLAFLGGMVYKAGQFVSSREIPRNVDIYSFREWSGVLGSLTWKTGGWGFPFGCLLPLGIIGLVCYWRELPVALRLFILLYPLSIILVFVSARYRVPMVPVLAPLAISGSVAAIRIIRSHQWPWKVLLIGSCVGMVLLTSVPGPFPEEEINYEAEMHYIIGTGHLEAGRNEQAVTHFTKALEIRPDYFSAHNNLGRALLKMERVDQAVQHFRQAVRTGSDHPGLHHNLGYGLTKQGDIEGAIGEFRKALDLQPDYIIALDALAQVLARCKNPEFRDNDEAIRLAQRACKLTGHQSASKLKTLAVAYAAAGRFAEATQVAKKALQLALSARQENLVKQLEHRLKLYNRGRAYPE